MHASGIVDIQSHRMMHALISIGNEIDSFVSPDFDPYNFGNIHVPFCKNENGEEDRTPILGHPIYRSDSCLSSKKRYNDPVEIRLVCEELVKGAGDMTFFDRMDWEAELHAFVRSLSRPIDEQQFETPEKMRRAMRVGTVFHLMKVEAVGLWIMARRYVNKRRTVL